MCESGLLGGVASLREGTSGSSREGNGIGEPGRGTEWVAGWGRAGSKMGKWWIEDGLGVLVSKHKQQPQAKISCHNTKRTFNDAIAWNMIRYLR